MGMSSGKPQGRKPLILVCTTIGKNCNYEYALLGIDARRAEKLVSYRARVEELKKQHDSFYCLEFFDYSITWGMGIHTDLVSPEGWCITKDAGIIRESSDQKVNATLCVTDEGVYWSAAPDFNCFETEVLSWSDLQAIIAGDVSRTFEKITDNRPKGQRNHE